MFRLFRFAPTTNGASDPEYGSSWWRDQLRRDPARRYVSDGDPRTHDHLTRVSHSTPQLSAHVQRFTRALALLLTVLGSGVELETWAVLVIQPLPLPVIEVVIVNDAAALCASEATSQRTVRVAPL